MSLNFRRFGKARVTQLLVAAALTAVYSARAATVNWSGASSGWANSANWSTGTVPATGDTVNITDTDANPRTITYNYTAAPVTLTSLVIDLTGTGLGTNANNLSMSANNLTAGNEAIGNIGNGKFTQSGGINTVNSAFTLGEETTSNGTYTLSGSGNLTAAAVESIGLNGIGSFIQLGGTHTVGTTALPQVVLIGGGTASQGNYTLSGSSSQFTVFGNEVIAATATGTTTGGTITQYGGLFTQQAGTHTVTGNLTLAQQSGSTAQYNLSGGTLNAATTGATFTLFEIIGGSGTAIFNQTGGAHIVGSPANNQTLYIGHAAGGNATYTLNAPAAALTVNGVMQIAAGPNSSAAFNLMAGTINSTSNEIIANATAAIATFTQTGGSNTVGGELFIGDANGSTGSYSLSGPASTLTTLNADVGGTSANSTATGSLTVSSGTMIVNGTLSLFSPTSTITLSGGEISVQSLTVSGSLSRFLWTGGTLNFQAGATIGTSFVLGSSLTLSSALTFSANPGQTITNNGSITLNGGLIQSGTFVTNSLLNGFGTITLSGGMTNAGQFIQSGGNLAITVSSTGLTNLATLSLNSSYLFQINGGNTSNHGAINLNGAVFSSDSALNNLSDGQIVGPGIIAASFSNAGNLVVPAGLTKTGNFTNAGTIEMAAASAQLAGATITNSAYIQGTGKISDAITNSGTIEPTGGTLLLTGSLTNTGTIRTATGTEVVVQGPSNFPTNAGLISLAGGTFDNGNQPLNNSGQITGFGVLATGGLTNKGILTFTGGTSTINGNVTNNPGQTINILYQPAVFTGNINNLGTINVTGTTITYTGTYTGNQYISDPSTNIFQNNVTIIPGGSMTGSPGDVFNFTGGTVINNGTFNNAGALQSTVNITNAGNFTQSGPQTWSPNTTFTNTSGTAKFQSDPGSPTSSPLSLIINGGTILFTGTQHLAALNLNAGTLGGYATILAPLTLGSSPHTIAPSATLAPTSAGTLTLSALATNSNTTLAFNLITPDHAATPSTNDRITLPTANTLTLNGGKIQIANTTTGAPSLGYYQAIQYNGSIQGTGLSSITLPATANNIVYTFDTLHDPGFIDLHKGFLGDANDDGIVNAIDLGILATNFNSTTATWSQGDYNHDGIVNAIDLGILATNFNAVISAGSFDNFPALELLPANTSQVPEPSTLALLGFAAAMLVHRRVPYIKISPKTAP